MSRRTTTSGPSTALEPLLSLPGVFEAPDPEDDEGRVDEGYAWRRVLRREEDRQIVQLIERHWDRDRQVNGIDT